MTLATFTPAYNPDQGGEIDETPRVLKSDLGDGYTQRVGNGINIILLKPTFSWTNLRKAQGMDIVNFFRAHKGYIPFYFTIPQESSPRVFICSSWKWKAISGGFMNISSATFEEAAPV